MSDLISKQVLCDDLREYKVHPVSVFSSDESEVKGYNDGIDLAISVIAEFLSIEPEQKTGHWIDTDNYYQRWKCSECGCHTRDAEPNYCPNCGADMRGE